MSACSENKHRMSIGFLHPEEPPLRGWGGAGVADLLNQPAGCVLGFQPLLAVASALPPGLSVLVQRKLVRTDKEKSKTAQKIPSKAEFRARQSLQSTPFLSAAVSVRFLAGHQQALWEEGIPGAPLGGVRAPASLTHSHPASCCTHAASSTLQRPTPALLLLHCCRLPPLKLVLKPTELTHLNGTTANWKRICIIKEKIVEQQK